MRKCLAYNNSSINVGWAQSFFIDIGLMDSIQGRESQIAYNDIPRKTLLFI